MASEKNLHELPCRHHILELISRAVFESKIKHVTTSQDLPIFKKFQDNFCTINPNNFVSGFNDIKCHVGLEDKRYELLDIFKRKKTCPR